MSDIMCPWFKTECKGADCGMWILFDNQCAVVSLALSVNNIWREYQNAQTNYRTST